MSEALTEAISTYLYAVPALETWGEGELFVTAELQSSSNKGMLFLSTPALGDKTTLERALARVRQGFERTEIEGWRGVLDEQPDKVQFRDDHEAGMRLRTLAIGLTAERTGD